MSYRRLQHGNVSAWDSTRNSSFGSGPTVTLAIYVETRSWPAHERYELTTQIRQAAVSIGSNLAEGCGRNSNAELSRSARIALGSTNEVEYQLMLARDLGYLGTESATRLLSDVAAVARMLSRLERKLVPSRSAVANS